MNDKEKKPKRKSLKERKKEKEAEIDKHIEEIQEQLDNNDIGIDFKSVKTRNKHDFPYALLESLIGFALLVALTGLFGWLSHSSLLIILPTLFIISFIDSIACFLIKRYLFRLYAISFGLIRLVPISIMLLLLSFFGKYINLIVISYSGMIITAILFILVKTVISLLIRGSYIKIIRK